MPSRNPAQRLADNVYRHEYEVVDIGLLWGTIERELPILGDAVAAELKRLDSGGQGTD